MYDEEDIRLALDMLLTGEELTENQRGILIEEFLALRGKDQIVEEKHIDGCSTRELGVPQFIGFSDRR